MVPNLFLSASPLTSIVSPHWYKCTQDITDLIWDLSRPPTTCHIFKKFKRKTSSYLQRTELSPILWGELMRWGGRSKRLSTIETKKWKGPSPPWWFHAGNLSLCFPRHFQCNYNWLVIKSLTMFMCVSLVEISLFDFV